MIVFPDLRHPTTAIRMVVRLNQLRQALLSVLHPEFPQPQRALANPSPSSNLLYPLKAAERGTRKSKPLGYLPGN